MNILITGGTSTIGKAIVMEFAHGNSLFLLSRDTKSNKLQELKEKALSLGSESVTFFNEDLGNYLDDKIDNIIKYNYDLFINIANSTSNLTDEDVHPTAHYYYTNVDLINPLIIIEKLLKNKSQKVNENKLVMVFISTILSKINSPNSIIYSSYKTLQEQYIKRFKNLYKNNFDFLIVNIGTRIDREKESIKTANIARSIKQKLKSGKKYLNFGIEGKILFLLYNINPMLCKSAIYLSRLLKNKDY